MAVCIRLARHGTKKAPYYRVVVADRRFARDGRFIENLGTFHPEGTLTVDTTRLDYWRGKGAEPSATLERLLKKQPPPAPPVA